MNQDHEQPGAEGHQQSGQDKRHEPERHWKLNIQNVVIEVDHPEIVVREALKLAGFDPEAGWIIVLKVAGEQKREVSLSTIIDLRHPGIEKLRLTPRQINNGEAQRPRRYEFALLSQDEAHLARLGLTWETVIDGQRRWLLIRSYPLPPGYTSNTTDIAVEIPLTYPTAQLDMFYCYPHVARSTGAVIPQTQHVETILGKGFQRWSRHRNWDSAHDTLATHLALIDESLLREVEP